MMMELSQTGGIGEIILPENLVKLVYLRGTGEQRGLEKHLGERAPDRPHVNAVAVGLAA